MKNTSTAPIALADMKPGMTVERVCRSGRVVDVTRHRVIEVDHDETSDVVLAAPIGTDGKTGSGLEQLRPGFMVSFRRLTRSLGPVR